MPAFAGGAPAPHRQTSCRLMDGQTKSKGDREAALIRTFAIVLRRGWPFATLGASRLKLRLDDVLYAVILRRRWRLHGRKFPTLDQHLDLIGVENFTLNERSGNSFQHIPIVQEDLLGRGIALVD